MLYRETVIESCWLPCTFTYHYTEEGTGCGIQLNLQLACIIACFGQQLHCRDAMMCDLVLMSVREDDSSMTSTLSTQETRCRDTSLSAVVSLVLRTKSRGSTKRKKKQAKNSKQQSRYINLQKHFNLKAFILRVFTIA